MEHQILNSKGEAITFTDMEKKVINHNQAILNSLGYEIPITTLTAITKRVVEQKFYEIKPSDYLPITVGEGAWSTSLLTYRSYNLGQNFAAGILDTGSANTRMQDYSSGVDSISVPIKNWGGTISYSIMELQIASKAGNWSLIESREVSRKTAWDLGIQRTAFLGLDGDTDVKGLLTLANVNANTDIINQYLSTMTATELNEVMGTIYQAYRLNSQYTAKPDRFIIPEQDFNGLASQMSEDFPIKTKLEVLEQMFVTMTGNAGFKILPLAYAGQAVNADVTGLGKNRYTLLQYNTDSLRMDIPVDYTNTLANSINSFQYQNVGYGQFTGAVAYRPLTVLYFDWSTS